MNRTACLDIVKRNSELFPEKPALIDPRGGHLSYSQLDEIIGESRKFFSEAGIRPGHRIAAVIPDGMIMGLAFLTLTAAAVFIPLSPELSVEQYRFFFQLLKIDGLILISGDECPAGAAAEEIGCAQYALNQVNSALSPAYRYSQIRPAAQFMHPLPLGDQDIAMICCTSGTTETPKLVMLSHENLIYSAGQRINHFELSEHDRCLLVTPLYRSITLKALQATLMAGGSVICWEKYTPSEFYHLLDAAAPTWFFAGPAVLKSIADHFDNYGYDPHQGTLRFIRTGGSFVPEKLAGEIEKLFAIPVVICYGLTETGIIASTYRSITAKHRHSVGRIFGCEVIIRDEIGRALPMGSIGEITVCGRGVMVGYDHQAPGSDHFAGDCFKTGDLGYVSASGELFLTGRVKEIINRGGEKVSPYEVESAILKNHLVQDVAVIGIPGLDGTEEVGAALVMTDTAIPLNIRELRAFLNNQISAYMMPTALCYFEEIPRNDAGKIDRIRLAMSFQEGQAQSRFKDPAGVEEGQNDLFEQKLLLLWRKILKTDEIGIGDDFFAAGGDSLKAAELYSGIEADFRVRIPLSVLFRKTTITDQAAFLRDMPTTREHWPFLVPIRQGGDLPAVFLVHGLKGDAETFHQMVEDIPEGYPIYGLSLNLGAGNWQHPIRLEDIARYYLQDVRRQQPDGPYRLAGLCIGGVIAFEMARQLREDGVETVFVGMFDSIITKRNTWKTRLQNNQREIADLGCRQWLAVKISTKCSRFKGSVEQLRYRRLKGNGDVQIPARNLRDTILRNAQRLYQPVPYAGEIVYFRPEQASDSSKASLEIWRKTIARVTVVQVPGSHNTMYLGPYGKNFAEIFDRCLRRSYGTADSCGGTEAGEDAV